MSKRLTQLQVAHLKSKLHEKKHDKMVQWNEAHPMPKENHELLIEDLKGGDLNNLIAVLKQKSTATTLKGMTCKKASYGVLGVEITLELHRSVALQKWEENRDKYATSIEEQADKIIDAAVFLGSEEALAMLEAF